MLLSFQMMDNTIGYQEGMSRKRIKRTWFNIDLPRESPVMGITRVTISNHPKLAPRTNKAKLPTWGQFKKLTIEKEKLVKEQGQSLTLATLFLAVLSVVTTTVGANHTYQAYVPNPFLLKPITWEDSSVLVFINDSSWLPGPFDPSLPLKSEEESQQLSNVSVSYTVGTDLTPICMGAETLCLKRGLQSWLSIVKEPQGNKIHFLLLEAFPFNITGENTTIFHPTYLIVLFLLNLE